MVEYQKLADQLVKDGFLLTALEFHAELQERGKTLKSLLNFFEDSTNFETFTRKLERSPAPSVSSVPGSQVGLVVSKDSLVFLLMICLFRSTAMTLLYLTLPVSLRTHTSSLTTV